MRESQEAILSQDGEDPFLLAAESLKLLVERLGGFHEGCKIHVQGVIVSFQSLLNEIEALMDRLKQAN